jgi:hypothetical protein
VLCIENKPPPSCLFSYTQPWRGFSSLFPFDLNVFSYYLHPTTSGRTTYKDDVCLFHLQSSSLNDEND